MDLDLHKYIIKSRRRYTVHFLNCTELNIDEIRYIFSKFGTIYKVAPVGDVCSVHFITYKTLKEAIKCVMGLKNHAVIKLLPETAKQAEQDYIKRINNTKQWKAQRTKKNYNRNNKNQLHVASDNESTTSKQFYKDISFWHEQSDSGNSSKHCDILSRKSAKLNTSCVNSPIHSEKSFQTKDITYKGEMSEISTLKCNTSEYDQSIESSDEISSSIQSTMESKIVLAHDVVVANVHKDFGVHFILHLFEKYKPIAVSLMKTVNQTGIRYCHVYFTESQHAFEVEKKFDKVDICGKSLIVLRSHKLLEEIQMNY